MGRAFDGIFIETDRRHHYVVRVDSDYARVDLVHGVARDRPREAALGRFGPVGEEPRGRVLSISDAARQGAELAGGNDPCRSRWHSMSRRAYVDRRPKAPVHFFRGPSPITAPMRFVSRSRNSPSFSASHTM